MTDTTTTPAAGLTPNRRAQLFLELVGHLQTQNQAQETARAAGLSLDSKIARESERRIHQLASQLEPLQPGHARQEAQKTLRTLAQANRSQGEPPRDLAAAFSRLERWDDLSQEIHSLTEARRRLPQQGSTRDLEWQQDRAKEALSATLLQQQRQLDQVYRLPGLARGKLERLAREQGDRAAYQTLLERPEALGALRGFEAAGLATPARTKARATAAELARSSLGHLDRLESLTKDVDLARQYQAVQVDLLSKRKTLAADRPSLLADLGRAAQGQNLEALERGSAPLTTRQRRLLDTLRDQERKTLEPLQKLTQQLEHAMYRTEPERFLDLAKKTAKLSEKAPAHLLARLGPESLRMAGAAVWVVRSIDRVVEKGVG